MLIISKDHLLPLLELLVAHWLIPLRVLLLVLAHFGDHFMEVQIVLFYKFYKKLQEED